MQNDDWEAGILPAVFFVGTAYRTFVTKTRKYESTKEFKDHEWHESDECGLATEGTEDTEEKCQTRNDKWAGADGWPLGSSETFTSSLVPR